MAVDLKNLLMKVGMRGITNDVGLRALSDITKLRGELSVVLCQAFNWRSFIQRYETGVPPLMSEVAKGVAESISLAAIFESCTPDEARALIEKTVIECAVQILDTTDSPPLDTPMQELGVDSLSAVEFRNTLQFRLGVRLPATTLFDYPTLGAIMDFVQTQVLESLGTEAVSVPASIPLPQDMMAAIEPLAIVGASCRLPGNSISLEAYWRMLTNSTDCVVDIPLNRWDVDSVYHPDPDVKGKSYVRSAGMIHDLEAEMFDNLLFSLPPGEVACMDPQQRLMLTVVQEACHSAGYSRDSMVGENYGVWIGCCNMDWHFTGIHSDVEKSSSYSGTGGAGALMSNRISYAYGLKGPSMTIDTACSSSLVAADAAIQSVRMGHCTGAVVGGVNLMLTPQLFVAFCKARMLAADGRCKTFDKSAVEHEEE
eukprot:Lankesteria_metandrocarpae@DN6253_c0_g1_i1.p1